MLYFFASVSFAFSPGLVSALCAVSLAQRGTLKTVIFSSPTSARMRELGKRRCPVSLHVCPVCALRLLACVPMCTCEWRVGAACLRTAWLPL